MVREFLLLKETTDEVRWTILLVNLFVNLHVFQMKLDSNKDFSQNINEKSIFDEGTIRVPLNFEVGIRT